VNAEQLITRPFVAEIITLKTVLQSDSIYYCYEHLHSIAAYSQWEEEAIRTTRFTNKVSSFRDELYVISLATPLSVTVMKRTSLFFKLHV